MDKAPTVVRLIRFPETLRLVRKGNQFIGPLRRSGPIVLSEHHEQIDVTFRITAPGVSFLTGGQSISVTEAFNEGEQRDVLLPWQLVVERNARIDMLILEVDVSYTGTTFLHTATVPLKLTYGVSRQRATAVAAGTALAAAAVAAVAVSRRRKRDVVVADEDEGVELALYNIGKSSKTTSPRRKVKGKVTVRDADETDLTVYNVGRAKARPTSKKASSKKASSSKKAASSKKATSSKKTAKKAPAKKAGGTGRGSAASRSAPRKGGRGSSAARKSPARRSTRKSR